MTPGLSWWLSRLAAMRPAEVAHRLGRLAGEPLDRLRIAAGAHERVPGAVRRALAGWRAPSPWYVDAAALAARRPPRAVLARAEAQCAGRRAVLGLGELALPGEPWHLEPRVGGTWPRRHARRALLHAPPGFDARLTWELSRGHDWVILARAHLGTGEARFAERLGAEVQGWLRANPVGVGINWASPMEAAIRIHSIAWTLALRGGAAAGWSGDAGLRDALLGALWAHLRFVAANLAAHSSANNHLVVELSALCVGARALGPIADLPRLHARALAALEREAARQVLADGVNVEMATHYHVFVLEALLAVALLERRHGAPRRALEAVARRMAGYVAALLLDDGTLLGQGDGDDGRVLACGGAHPARALARLALALGSEQGDRDRGRGRDPHPPLDPERDRDRERGDGRGREQEDADEDADADADDLLLLLGGGRPIPPLVRPRRSRVFGASGQVVLRAGALQATLDAGPFGFGALAAHAHCDALAVNVALEGRRLLVDRGTGRYNGDRATRDRFRLTAAHSTLQLGEREQADPAGPFLWSRRPAVRLERCELAGAGGDLAVASHDGFAPARHRRLVARAGEALLVLDGLAPCPPGARLALRWHLAPGLEARPVAAPAPAAARGAGTLLEARDRSTGRVAGLLWLDAPADELQFVEVPHSDAYGAIGAALTVERRWIARAAGDAAAVTVILAAGADPADARARLAAVALRAAGPALGPGASPGLARLARLAGAHEGEAP